VSGMFITFEGAEGSGKSTQIARCEQYLKQQGHDVLVIREPGGVKISETVRAILLDPANTEMGAECEVLLYMAARAQLVREVILPALDAGRIILCDRFLDSTLVYQGFGHGMDLEQIRGIGDFATCKIAPSLTILFDIDTAEGLRRAGDQKDRIEQRSLEYHSRVRQGYLTLARQEPQRIKVVGVDGRKKEDIFQEVRGYLDARIQERR